MPGYNLTRAEAEERAGLISVRAYDVTLDLTEENDTFPSTTVIRFSCRTPGAETFLDLIAPAVRKLTLNGQDLDPALHFSDSRIRLPGLESENVVVVEADQAYSHTGEGLHSFTDPVDSRRYVYTQCEVADARRIFPTFEQPDLKSRFTFHVIAPAQWTVISNQPTPKSVPVASSGEQKISQWDFTETPVMPTYLIAIIAGSYERWFDSYLSTDGRAVPLGAFVRRSMAQYFDADEIFDITKRGFDFYETAFGMAFPYAKYDQIFVPQYNAGAMENIGAITLTEERYVFRSRPVQAQVDTRANTILHEQAHMWFGDLVTMKWWNDLWLNESFAEYMSHLAASNTRWPEAWTDFLASRKLVGYQQDQLPTTHPIVAEINDLADVEVNFDMITYAKGASVLKQLVAWVGQENFLKGVHNYLKKYAWGNATLQDFLAEVGEASGRDLTQWSKVWLEEAGVTTLRPIISERVEGVYEKVSIAQEVPPVYSRFASIPHRDLPEIHVSPSLRPHRIGIAGYSMSSEGLTQSWVYQVDIDGASTDVLQLAGEVIPDLLIINDGDLTYAKLRLDEDSNDALPLLIRKITDPLTRALVWGSLWDSVRDGELSARRYIDIVLNSINYETSSTTMMSLLMRLRTAVYLYVAPEFQADAKDDAAARLVALAMRADPGSDEQLQFFKAFAGLACNPTQLGFVADVLDGASEVPGLKVDTDLRWELLIDLVATGLRGEADIAAELQRDNTMSGTEKAAGARAAIPTLEAKRLAWHLAVMDESVSNATQRNILATFTKVPDPALLREFAIEYFAQIENTWETRTREMAQNIITALYPLRSVNDPEVNVLAMTDQWLDRLGASSPALRRLVLASREEVIRAELAQEVDSQA